MHRVQRPTTPPVPLPSHPDKFTLESGGILSLDAGIHRRIDRSSYAAGEWPSRTNRFKSSPPEECALRLGPARSAFDLTALATNRQKSGVFTFCSFSDTAWLLATFEGSVSTAALWQCDFENLLRTSQIID